MNVIFFISFIHLTFGSKCMIKKILLIILSTFLVTEINAQSIRINEASASNSIYFDEDGDRKDFGKSGFYHEHNRQ